VKNKRKLLSKWRGLYNSYKDEEYGRQVLKSANYVRLASGSAVLFMHQDVNMAVHTATQTVDNDIKPNLVTQFKSQVMEANSLWLQERLSE